MVKGDKSPFDGDLIYWSKRNNELYHGLNSKLLAKQNHTCGCCGVKFTNNEIVNLHNIDGNHNNSKVKKPFGCTSKLPSINPHEQNGSGRLETFVDLEV